MSIFSTHISRKLAALIDGELREDAHPSERHLRQCASCQADYDQIKFGMTMIDHLPPVEAPAAVWVSIEVALETAPREKRPAGHGLGWVLAGAALALAGLIYWRIPHEPSVRWEVIRLEGAPFVGTKHVAGTGNIAAGEWLETDVSSRAQIKVGDIGSVEVEPNTRLRVVKTKAAEHRIALSRGEIRAKISAPPRLFFVDTAAGTAIDLGCEYTLETDQNGSGLLRVTRGWVSFQWKEFESLVPAGASCHTRTPIGPGIPYFDDAPEVLKQSLDTFAAQKSQSALSVVLAEARVRDTLTLWHLLSRVDAGDRELVYDRIAALAPVPAAVSRERVLKLDPGTLRLWKEELAWKW
jgi:hypothetical protein